MFWNPQKSKLDAEIDRALLYLETCKVDSDEYAKTLDRVEKLHKMREQQTPKPVSRDTLVLVGANIVGILLVIRHEYVGNILTSRAMTMLAKTK